MNLAPIRVTDRKQPDPQECPVDHPVSPAIDRWRAITTRVRDGDSGALELLYDTWFPLVFCEVRSLTGRDEATCLDLTQDAFLKVIRHVRPIDNEPRLKAWLRTVARSTCYDWLRKQARESRRLQLVSKSGFRTAGDHFAQDEENRIRDEARRILLEQHLAALPPGIQEMMSLRFRLGWTLARIAKSLGKKAGAVDGQLRRAIESLREQLNEVGDE